jgi:hypothetical protein
LLRLGKDIRDTELPNTARVIKELITGPNTPWLLRALMTFALGEMGASLSPDEANIDNTNQPEEPKTNHPKPADRPGMLPDVLTDTTRHTTPRPLVETKITAFLMAFALAEEQETVSWPSRGVERLNQPSPSDQALPARPEVETASTETAAFLLAFVLAETPDQPAPSDQSPLTRSEIEALLKTSSADPVADVRQAAQVAHRLLAGQGRTNGPKAERIVLSIIEKIIFLKEVPFFQGMTVNQLGILARVCEEVFFEKDRQIFHQGDPSDALYVIISGQVGIEQENGEGDYIRLAILGAHDHFGEMTLFDNSSRTASAVALQDTLMLRLRREPLVALARQYPDVSLELIQILSQQLRKAYAGRAELMRSRSREL